MRGRHRYAIETGLKYGPPGIVDVPAIGAHGGVIEDVLDCIDHICQLVGPDHAGLGSDFDGFDGTLRGLEDVTKMGAIRAGLRRRGFAEDDIAKISGFNFLRVWDTVYARAAAK